MICLNKFISIYESPDSIQSDNGLEFSNKLLYNYYKKKIINVIHSSVRHPCTNGGVKRIHRAVCKSMYAERLKNKEKYDMEFALVNAVSAQNNMILTITKYKAVDLFFNCNEDKVLEINFNTKMSQKNTNKNINPIKKYSKILILNSYKKKGKSLQPEFCKKGFFLMPAC